MKSSILDGRLLAAKIEKQLVGRVGKLNQKGVTPGMAIILLKNDLASEIFVKNKINKAAKIGIKAIVERLDKKDFLAKATELVKRWNADPNIHGIIIQLPKNNPKSLGEAVRSVLPIKDVDCLHPENIGLLSLSIPRFLPPTPAGIQKLLIANKISIEGKNVVIVGRGNLVGRPLALTLLQKDKNSNATVTVCHRHTADLERHTKNADILVVAIGQPEFITGKYIKRGGVVIDVGVHKIGDKWYGDVKHDDTDKIASAISPVPGGVGPMTVIMLLQNVIIAAERSIA
jgi:methylenetetrahydrofolate dehydrogenase (NADP+)/methenyltetrahydrofolate cyclohydrolase